MSCFLHTVSPLKAGHNRVSVFLELNNLTATVNTVSSHVVTAMTLTSFTVSGYGRCSQCIVGSAHVTLGSGFSVLLYCHGGCSYLRAADKLLPIFNQLRSILKA
jgi:hypothetical protein